MSLLVGKMQIFVYLFLIFAIGVIISSVSVVSNAADNPQSMVVSGDKTADVYINTYETRQTIDGFGGSVTWYDNWLTDNPNAKEVFDLLFKDAGLDILRIKNNYKYKNSNPQNFNAATTAKVVDLANEAAGKRLTLLMSSWSPSADLKSNNSINGGGSLKKDKNGEYIYDELGQYWYDLLKAYADQGVKPDYISIQNEPDWKVDYDGCELDPVASNANAGYGKAFNAVYKKISKLPNPPKMLGPEIVEIGISSINNYLRPILNETPDQLYGIAHHLYSGGDIENPDSFIENMREINKAYPDMIKWQTEYYRGTPLQTAWVIHNAMVEEEVNAYLYWDLIWAHPGSMIGMENPYSKGSWKTEKGYEVGDKFYALKHFSKFIEPGYQRVDVSAAPWAKDIKVSSYISSDRNRLIVVLINTSGSDAVVRLAPNGFDILSSKVYLSNFQEGETDRFSDKGSLKSGNILDLPAFGVATVDISGTRNEESLSSAATLYGERGYRTEISVLGPGEYTKDDLADLGADMRKISSLRLQYGYIVTLYGGRNFDGKSWSFIANVDDLGKYGCFNVSSIKIAKAEIRNVAAGKRADSNYMADRAARAVDGSDSTSWSVTGDPPMWISLDLGDEYIINRWVVRNTGSGPMSSSVDGKSPFNAADYKLQKSEDGQNWSDVDEISDNQDDITDRTVDQFRARYIRVYVTKPSSYDAIKNLKIYEVEIYGVKVTE